MMESGETLLNNHWLGNRGESISYLVGTISNVLVMEISWTELGSGGYILVSILVLIDDLYILSKHY
jgi:hypothetical protein